MTSPSMTSSVDLGRLSEGPAEGSGGVLYDTEEEDAGIIPNLNDDDDI